MKDKPELNHNSTVATYGMSASIPDPAFMNEMIRLHSAAVLDALPWESPRLKEPIMASIIL